MKASKPPKSAKIDEDDVEMAMKKGNKALYKKKIEIVIETSGDNIHAQGEISPAFKTTTKKSGKPAVVRMGAVGSDTVWPRKDNAFMAK